MDAATLTTDRAVLARRMSAAGLSQRALASGLFGWLALQQLLLWRFLGFDPVAVGAGAVAFAGLLAAIHRLPGWARETVAWRTLAPLFAVSLVIFILGGAGRLVYANTDWQVRNAVLRDLVEYPWPFVYSVDGGKLLRLPLGLYLAPAGVGQSLGQRAAEVAMLFQNSIALTALLALGRGLFASHRARVIALAVVIGFSGMDAIGALMTGRPLVGHIERWPGGLQFSSHLTQAFWAPQHGLAGWLGALLYLLWLDKRAPAAAVLGAVPLLALLSPFALLGVLPFAAHVGWSLLRARGIGVPEIALPGAAALLALPSLLYLTAAGETVGGAVALPRVADYFVFELVEVGLLLYALWLARHAARFAGAPFALVAAAVLLAPLGRMGTSVDFVMRASIPALTVLAVMLADLLATPRSDPAGRRARVYAGTALLIGLVTPADEVLRALVNPRAPAMLCSYLGVVPGGAATYVARLSRVPAAVRPRNPTLVTPHDPRRCWGSPWPDPVG